MSETAIFATIFDGIAKPIPLFPPLRERIALFIPIRAPRLSTSAPPEFPGLIEASVCIKFSY